METLLHNLSEVFAVSIIHSLWQCLIIYLLLRIFMADIVRLSSAVKYNITVAALFAATGWFIYTLFAEAAQYSWQLTVQTAAPQHLLDSILTKKPDNTVSLAYYDIINIQDEDLANEGIK